MAEAPAKRTPSRLSSFLELGFFVDGAPAADFALPRAVDAALGGLPDRERFDLCAARLREAVAKDYDPRRDHLLPLSGGLDSRALLGLLLEQRDAERIDTCTFGTPGTWDFELGNQLARVLGTRHVQLPLDTHRFQHDELLETSRRIGHQSVLFHHPPLSGLAQRFGGHLWWSGFLGDKLAKACGPADPGGDAPARFLDANRYLRSLPIDPEAQQGLRDALRVPAERQTPLGADENLNFEFRQRRFVAPHVLPRGFDYATPFTDAEVIAFFVSLPRAERVDSRFYKRFLADRYPMLFSIGTKNLEGLPLGASRGRVLARRLRRKLRRSLPSAWFANPDPMLNYLDFDRAFRERSDLREIAADCTDALHAREVLAPLDPRAIWQSHLRGEGEHADALILFTSLEIHLRAGLVLDAEAGACSS